MPVENFNVTIQRSNHSDCNYLPKTYYQVSDAKHISDVIGEDWLYSWTPKTPVFISAQTGSGKNHFIKNTLIPGFLRHKPNDHTGKILILSNRIALNRQSKFSIAETIDSFAGRYEQKQLTKIKDCSDSGFDKLEDFGDVFICSYQNLLNNTLLDNAYDFVVIDEFHFFVSDSLFNQNTGKILDTIITKFKNSVRIYMSATPDEVLTKIIEKETHASTYADAWARNIPFSNLLSLDVSLNALPFYIKKDLPEECFLNNQYSIPSIYNIDNFEIAGVKIYANNAEDKICLTSYNDKESTYILHNHQNAWIYDTIRDYSFLNIKYFSMASTNLVSTIYDIVSNSYYTNSDDKWLIFVSNKSDGKALEQYLNENLTSKSNDFRVAMFVSAESKTSLNSDANTYSTLIKEEKFNEHILISTSVLDNGINISDSTVKNIIILNFNRTQFLQMLGRIRIKEDSSVNLFLNIPSVETLKTELNEHCRDLISYLSYEYSSAHDRQQFHSRLLSSSVRNNSWSIDDQERLYFNELAKIKLLYNIKFLKNLFIKHPFLQNNLTLTDASSKKIELLLKDALYDAHKDLLFRIYSHLPDKISSDIYNELLYLPDDIGESLAYLLYFIPSDLQDYSIPAAWDHISNDDLYKNIDHLVLKRYYTYPRKNISSLDYSYLKKYQFFSNKINAVLEQSLGDKKMVSRFRMNQKKYRLLFNRNLTTYSKNLSDNDIYNLTIINEQLSWIERLGDFNKKNFHFTNSQKETIQEKQTTLEVLTNLLDKHAISQNEYTEFKNNPSKNFLLSKFLSREQQETFKQEFTSLYITIFGKRSKDKKNDPSYGANKIKKCLNEHLPLYTIESLPITEKKSTYWVIIKNS